MFCLARPTTAVRRLGTSQRWLTAGTAGHLVRRRTIPVCSRFSVRSPWLRPWFLRYIPPGGYPLDIEYVDTRPDAAGECKTLVLLHGTPGSFYDFFPLVAQFGQQYRIIAANFPDFTHTVRHNGSFWHSAEEKSELVSDLLRELGVHQVDCLVSHSLSAYAASYLWLYANRPGYFRLRSVCLLSPVGQFTFVRRHQLKMMLITQMSRSLVLRRLLPARWMNPSGKPVPRQSIARNIDIAAWKAATLYLSNYQNYHLRLKALAALQIPSLFVFGGADRLYRPECYHQQLLELEVDYDAFDIYEQYENNLIQQASNRSWIKVVELRSAGHYVHNTHSLLIHSYIEELLDRTTDTPLLD